MPTVDVELLAHQHAFVTDLESKILALSGGFGSGKTYAAAAKACTLGDVNWPCDGLIVEPTYPMVRDILVPTFRRCLTEWRVPFRYHKTDHILTIRAGRARPFDVYLRSGDHPENIVGFNAGWALIDEFELQDFAVFKMVLARVRDKRATVRQIGLTGTPEGFGWGYDLLEVNPRPGTRLIRARTRDNVHNADEYEQTLRENLSDAEASMYLEGVRTKREGRVYGRFDRAVHLRPCVDIRGEHYVGADFNVRKMAWVLATRAGESLHVWGEVVREDTDTIAQADECAAILARAYSDAYRRPISPREAAQMTTIVCDAAGNSASTSSKESDVALLIRAGFKVKHMASNPFIEDRVLSVNLLLQEERLLVDPRAAYALRCIEQQGYAKDGKPEKHSDPKQGLDHGADALGYLAFWLWPAAKPRANATAHHGVARNRRSASGAWIHPR